MRGCVDRGKGKNKVGMSGSACLIGSHRRRQGHNSTAIDSPCVGRETRQNTDAVPISSDFLSIFLFGVLVIIEFRNTAALVPDS